MHSLGGSSSIFKVAIGVLNFTREFYHAFSFHWRALVVVNNNGCVLGRLFVSAKSVVCKTCLYKYAFVSSCSFHVIYFTIYQLVLSMLFLSQSCDEA